MTPCSRSVSSSSQRRDLAERGLRRHAAGRGLVEFLHLGIVGQADVPVGQRIAHGRAVHGRQRGVQQAGAVELAEDRHDPAGAVDVLHVHVVLGRGDLAQARHVAAQPVDILHGEIDPGLVRGGEQVEHGIGRSAHRDIEAHRVLERFEAGDSARQDAFVVLLVIALGQGDDEAAGAFEQALAVGMGGKLRAVARQREAERLGQAIHRIGGEHAAARSAGRAGRPLDARHFLVGDSSRRRRRPWHRRGRARLPCP